MSAFGISGSSTSNSNNDYEIQGVSDGIQDIAWSPTSNLLVAGSWDSMVRCWEVQQQGSQLNAVPKAQINHDGPVLCTAFSADGSTVFSGSCDKTAKMWQLGGSTQGQQIAAHDAPIKCIAPIQEQNCIVTGSWDKTLKYWDTRSSSPQATVQLPERCYAMSIVYPLMVVATAERHVLIYNLQKPTEVYTTMESPLKFQTRCVSCFPDMSGFAIGSIEGRVGIHHVEQKDAHKNFAFKCHRDGQSIYPVNSICFHPFGTFSTAGGDGTVNFWDKDSKQRLKAFNKCNQPITVGKFNARGDIFGYALSYDWYKGSEGYNTANKNSIYLHYTPEAEVKQKKKTGR